MIQSLTMVGYVLCPSLVALAGLVIRLRWQVVRDRMRQRTVQALAGRLSAAGTIDIHDVAGDGSELRVHLAVVDTRRGNE